MLRRIYRTSGITACDSEWRNSATKDIGYHNQYDEFRGAGVSRKFWHRNREAGLQLEFRFPICIITRDSPG
jgi:hypothetical protein